jgi:hypothetical protein
VGTSEGRPYTLRATYTKGVTNIGVPPALRRALVSDQTLRFNGSPEIRSSTTTTNADVHANVNLDAQGSPVNFVIEGYGTHTGEYDGNNTAFFQPNQTDPTATGTTYQSDALYVPTVDVGAMASVADAVTTPPPGSPFSTSSTANVYDDLTDGLDPSLAPTSMTGKGTKEAPFVWYVGGNMELRGQHRFPAGTGATAPQGHLQLYVDGDLVIGSSGGGKSATLITPTYSNAPTSGALESTVRDWVAANLPEGSSLAIYVNGNVTFNGGVTVAALIHSNGEVRFNGGANNVNIIGSVVSKADMTFNGNNELWYTEASETVRAPGYNYDVPTGVFLLDYLEWPE